MTSENNIDDLSARAEELQAKADQINTDAKAYFKENPRLPTPRMWGILKILMGMLLIVIILPMWSDIISEIDQSGIGGAIRAKFLLGLVAFVGVPILVIVMIVWGWYGWISNGTGDQGENTFRAVFSVTDFFTVESKRTLFTRNIIIFFVGVLILSIMISGGILSVLNMT